MYTLIVQLPSHELVDWMNIDDVVRNHEVPAKKDPGIRPPRRHP